MKKSLRKLIIAFGTLTIIIVIVFSPFLYYVFNLNFYTSLYEKNDVYKSIDRQDAIKLTEDLFNFFKYRQEFQPFILKNNLPYFTNDETSHLNDVRIIFNKIFLTYYICLGLSVVFIIILFERNIRSYLKNISLLLILPSAILIFLLIILYFFSQNFISLFDKFHLVFFPQGNFAFPEDSTMITLLPLNFFYDFFIRLVTSSAIISIVFIIVGVTLHTISKKIYKDGNPGGNIGRI
ncbi:DUF1461 domain-containing protein [bacterium]|nr:DUF1461 domain-containing protein [bacterium]